MVQGFFGGSVAKNLPANAGDTGSIPWLEDPLEKEMVTHSNIPWTEKPGGLQSMGSQRLSNYTTTKDGSRLSNWTTTNDGSKVELCKISLIWMAPPCRILSFSSHGKRGYIIEKEVPRTSKKMLYILIQRNGLYFLSVISLLYKNPICVRNHGPRGIMFQSQYVNYNIVIWD